MNSYYERVFIASQTNSIPEKAEYEHCSFDGFDFNTINLSGYIFIDCTFESCNLSMCGLSQTSFRNVIFKNCKLLGLRWDHCQVFMFAVHFENCKLDMSNFYGVRLKKANFKSSSLKDVDFTEADMTDVSLDDCDCSGAVFEQTNLANADLRTAIHYIINPNQNNVKNAKFNWPAANGLLVSFGVKIED